MTLTNHLQMSDPDEVLEHLSTVHGVDPNTVENGDEVSKHEQEHEEQTWTFFGHWDNDRIVVEYVIPGDVQDEREDAGYWEQGLWAASASGRTQDEARASVIAEYEDAL